MFFLFIFSCTADLFIAEKYERSFAIWKKLARYSNLSCAAFSTATSCDDFGEVSFAAYVEPRKQHATQEKIFLAAVVDVKRPLLVQHFITHYKSLGVELADFLIVVNFQDVSEQNSRGAKTVKKSLERCNISFVSWTGPFTTGVKHVHLLHLVSTRVSTHDWIIWADSDEFHHFPMRVVDFVDLVGRNSSTAVRGYLVDRLAREGELHPIRAGQNIQVQFPLQCQITTRLLKGNIRKVVLTKGSYVDAGHHAIPSWAYFSDRGTAHLLPPWLTQSRVSWWNDSVYIAHYKWTAGAVEYLKSRMATYSERKLSWWPESSRLVHYNGSLLSFCKKPA
jgi:hypothetical protein